MTNEQPVPNTFYEDTMLGKLHWSLGTRRVRGKATESEFVTQYIFNSSIGERVVTSDIFNERFKQVDPGRGDYEFHCAGERAFYEEVVEAN